MTLTFFSSRTYANGVDLSEHTVELDGFHAFARWMHSIGGGVEEELDMSKVGGWADAYRSLISEPIGPGMCLALPRAHPPGVVTITKVT